MAGGGGGRPLVSPTLMSHWGSRCACARNSQPDRIYFVQFGLLDSLPKCLKMKKYVKKYKRVSLKKDPSWQQMNRAVEIPNSLSNNLATSRSPCCQFCLLCFCWKLLPFWQQNEKRTVFINPSLKENKQSYQSKKKNPQPRQ